MSNKIPAQLAELFCCEPLPATVCADPVARQINAPHRSGTNLLTVAEAKAMFTSMLLKLDEKYDEDTLLDLADESRREMESTWDLSQPTLREVYEAGYMRGFRQALGAYDA